MSTEKTGKERRRSRRYPAAELRASLRVKKGLLNETWEEVAPSDFSRHGIAVETAVDFKLSDTVPLSISLHMEMGVIQIDRITGIIRHKKLLGKQIRYGIEFDLSQKVKGIDLDSQLARVEGLLERSHNLAKRIIDQNKR